LPSFRGMTRYPSNLISWSQPGPAGGLSASAGWQGRMKPGGLERVRIGRETRQSILARHVTGCGSDCASRRRSCSPEVRFCTSITDCPVAPRVKAAQRCARANWNTIPLILAAAASFVRAILLNSWMPDIVRPPGGSVLLCKMRFWQIDTTFGYGSIFRVRRCILEISCPGLFAANGTRLPPMWLFRRWCRATSRPLIITLSKVH
jgi:hypothetical protein